MRPSRPILTETTDPRIYELCHSWLKPDGNFIPVKGGDTHGDVAGRLFNKPNYNSIHTAFENGYARIAGMGCILYAHIENNKLTDAQIRGLINLCKQTNYEQLIWDGGDREKILYTINDDVTETFDLDATNASDVKFHHHKTKFTNRPAFYFTINGKEYRLEIALEKSYRQTIAHPTFEIVNPDIDRPLGITNTGDSFLVLSKVVKILYDFVSKNKIDYIVFSAEESSRMSLYNKILEKLIKKYNFPYERLYKDPRTNEPLDPQDFVLGKCS